MGELGWGILGTGNIARTFARDLQAADLRVVAVGSRSAEGARAFGDELAVPNRHASYEGLCADPAVDVVYVATPNPAHYANAILALRAGKHVLVEKPFTLNAAQARELVGEAKKRNRFLMEAMWTRFLPTMDALRNIIGSGKLGAVRAVIADHCQYLPMERSKRLHLPELGGGALLDLGVYPLSLAHMLLGVPSEIAATARLTHLGVDENLGMTLAWASGARASLYADMMGQGPNRAAVVGEKGWVELDRVWYCQTDFKTYSRDGKVTRQFGARVAGRGMQCEAQELERLVAEGRIESPLMSHAASVEVMEMIDAIKSKIGVRYPDE